MPSIDEWIMKTGYIYTKDMQKKKNVEEYPEGR